MPWEQGRIAGGFVTYGTNRLPLTGVGMPGKISVSPHDALLLGGSFLSIPRRNPCGTGPRGSDSQFVVLWSARDPRRDLVHTLRKIMVVEVPPATDLVSGVLPRLHLHQSGLTLTLGGVEHPFGLHLASEGLVSWSMRAKLCQICPLCIASNFPRHMDCQASCGGD